jgi:hypothetical protein
MFSDFLNSCRRHLKMARRKDSSGAKRFISVAIAGFLHFFPLLSRPARITLGLRVFHVTWRTLYFDGVRTTPAHQLVIVSSQVECWSSRYVLAKSIMAYKTQVYYCGMERDILFVFGPTICPKLCYWEISDCLWAQVYATGPNAVIYTSRFDHVQTICIVNILKEHGDLSHDVDPGVVSGVAFNHTNGKVSAWSRWCPRWRLLSITITWYTDLTTVCGLIWTICIDILLAGW